MGHQHGKLDAIKMDRRECLNTYVDLIDYFLLLCTMAGLSNFCSENL